MFLLLSLQADLRWEKYLGGRLVRSLTFLDHGGQTLVLYTTRDSSVLSGRRVYTLEAVTRAGDPVTDLPATFTAFGDPRRVTSYPGGPSYSPAAVTTTPDGGVALRTQVCY